jgi:hypothetical protein
LGVDAALLTVQPRRMKDYAFGACAALFAEP